MKKKQYRNYNHILLQLSLLVLYPSTTVSENFVNDLLLDDPIKKSPNIRLYIPS